MTFTPFQSWRIIREAIINQGSLAYRTIVLYDHYKHTNTQCWLTQVIGMDGLNLSLGIFLSLLSAVCYTCLPNSTCPIRTVVETLQWDPRHWHSLGKKADGEEKTSVWEVLFVAVFLLPFLHTLICFWFFMLLLERPPDPPGPVLGSLHYIYGDMMNLGEETAKKLLDLSALVLILILLFAKCLLGDDKFHLVSISIKLGKW